MTIGYKYLFLLNIEIFFFSKQFVTYFFVYTFGSENGSLSYQKEQKKSVCLTSKFCYLY